MERRAAQAAGPYVVLAIPLLVEGGAPRPRGPRSWSSMPMSRAAATADERATASRESRPARSSRRRRLARAASHAADDVLVNSGTVAELRHAVDRLHQRYLRSPMRRRAGAGSINLNPRFTLALRVGSE